MKQRPLILISNDDGFEAKGINSLIEMLAPIGRLVVVAPDGGRSGKSCSITSDLPITSYKVSRADDVQVYACSGTPADCVKLALDKILDTTPDIVVSGINHGSNASVNAHYSGTVGAALEAAMKGIPAVAFSLCNHSSNADFEPLTSYVQMIVRYAIEESAHGFILHGSLLNVNFPNRKDFAGIKVCRMAYSMWTNELERREHPYGDSHYYWLVGTCVNTEPESTDTDLWALEHGYVAITPIDVDVTHYAMLSKLRERYAYNVDSCKS